MHNELDVMLRQSCLLLTKRLAKYLCLAHSGNRHCKTLGRADGTVNNSRQPFLFIMFFNRSALQTVAFFSLQVEVYFMTCQMTKT